MATALADAHIAGQQRLRYLTTAAVTGIWTSLPGYNEEDVPLWLARVLPVIAAAQRQSVSLTQAFLARSIGRQPLGINPDDLTGAALRAGAAPADVYRRPFVTIWTALSTGTDWPTAVNAGLARATSTAATDVQLAMRETLRAVGEADPQIYGYERVADANACELCLIASTQRYHVAQLMPIHNHCGCGVEVITDPDVGRVINRERYQSLKSDGAMDRITRQRQAPRARQRALENRKRAERTRLEATAETNPERRMRLEQRADNWDRRADAQEAMARGVTAEVREHGELGPVLVNGDHSFTEL